MKKLIPFLFIGILLAAVSGCVSTAPAPSTDGKVDLASLTYGKNILKNSTFDKDDPAAKSSIAGVAGGAYWTFSINGGGAGGDATCVSEGGVLHIGNYTDGGSATYAIQLIQSPITVEKGYAYKVKLDAKASAARTIDIKVGGTGDRGWADYTRGKGVGTIVEIGTTMQTYEFNFEMKDRTDDQARFEIQLGVGMDDVWLDNVMLLKGDKVK
ncbi:MAG: carbohydrate binding domain-containing protein [Spirochaetales bacterium]|nr:carbohydrate binding domain-containing protein [Spirochaetales bacterium]